MATFCKDCKFIQTPQEIETSIGKSWGAFTCECVANKTAKTDWFGEETFIYKQTPYERNADHNCHLYENALTGETNPSVELPPVEEQPVVTAEMTKEELAFIITQKKIIFGKDMIARYSSMNSLKEFSANQVVSAALKFSTIQSLLLCGSIGTVYGIISSLVPNELVLQEEIDYFKALIENFNLEIAPLTSRLEKMINPPPVVIPEPTPEPEPETPVITNENGEVLQ